MVFLKILFDNLFVVLWVLIMFLPIPKRKEINNKNGKDGNN